MEDGGRVGLILGGKALELINRLNRLRVGGEVVDRVVLLGVLELARQRAEREQHHQPHRDHRELCPPAARELGQRGRLVAKSLPH